jgi:NADH-quinone oxidoreductase subunit H
MVEIVRFLLGGWIPDWLIYLIAYIVVTTILLIVAPLTMMMQVWFERRAVARMQDRLGPNRVGPAGLLQSIADGVKMFTKEDIVPRAADKWVHLLAPIIAVAPVMFMLAVIPWGRGVVPADVNISVLFVVAISSVSAVGLMMAGWGSNNKFALLGAMRAVAQMVSYEIPAVLALLSIVLVTGTMSLARLPDLQAGIPFLGNTLNAYGVPDLGLGWFIFTPVGFLAGIVFYICVLSEGERTPFDIPEADSEIVAGYMTEYSGMKFGVFYIGQFLLNFVLSMVASTAFLGGWQGPGVAQLVALGGFGEFAGGVLSLVYMLAKTWFLFFAMIWIRGAYPRLRVDQLMGFAWKFLLPLTLVNILSGALWVAITQWGVTTVQVPSLPYLEGLEPWARQLIALVVTLIINVGVYLWLLQVNRRRPDETPAELAEDQAFGAATLS